MKFDLIKQKCKVSSYKIDGEYTEYEVESHIFYVKGIPAFMILKKWRNRSDCTRWNDYLL